MAAGELNLQLSTSSPQAQTLAPEERDLPPLPAELKAVGKSLVKALDEDQQVAQAFATFCSAAYVKPDWAGAASEFLAELFAEHEDLLAELTRIPDLIIELGSGHVTLTCMVAARWAARGETHRLARLAEALIATQSKMSGTTAVVEVMLALTTSLALTRYSRAEQLLNAAEPQATEDQQEALTEARLWLAAGRIVRGCSQEVRDLWDQRLRRSRQAWSWESPEEREALMQLADHLEEGLEGLSLFEPVVPTAWWDLASLRAKERKEPAEQAAPKPQASAPVDRPAPPTFAAAENAHDNLPNLTWTPLSFIAGTLMGGLSLTFFIWLAQPWWISKQPHAAATPAHASQAAVAANTEQSKAPPATPDAEPKMHLIPPADATPPPSVANTPAPAAATEAPAPAVPTQPPAEWRAEELKNLAIESPELASLATAAKHGSWAENELVLKGDSLTAPRTSPNYQKLLLWLHLDPPDDPEVRAKIPALLVDLRADDPVLDLWKKLIYDGSPNATDIRNEAKKQIHNNAEVWTVAQRNRLMEIAGWGAGTAAP